MYPHQRKWWDLKNYIKLLVGGYGSGKTHIGSLRIIRNSIIDRDIPQQYVSPSYQMAKRTVIPSIQSILTKMNVPYTFNKSEHEFNIPLWGGKIWIGSGDNPDSLKGPNIGSGLIDEPFIQSREVFEQINARVRHPESKVLEIGLTGTPEQLNWGYDLTLDQEIDIGIVRGSTRDAKALPESYLKNLMKLYTDDQVRAFIDGEFINLQAGRAVTNFSRDIVQERKIDLRGQVIEFGIDFNVDWMTALLFQDYNGTIHYFDEIRMPMNSNTFEIVDEIRKRYNNRLIAYPDASGSARKTSSTKSDHQIIRDAGIMVTSPHSNPPVKDRVNIFISMIKNRRTTIDPKCVNLIRDCEIMTWKNGVLNEGSDHSLSHAFDAASYPVHYKYGIDRGKLTYKKWTA